MPPLHLFGRKLLAIDGTRIKAVDNQDRSFTRSALQDFIREADDCLTEYLHRLDAADCEEGGTGVSARVDKLAEQIAAFRGKRDQPKSLLSDLLAAER